MSKGGEAIAATTLGRAGWNQAWRKPLREAMDWLRDTLATSFELAAQEYLKDPWQTRNDYVSVVMDRSETEHRVSLMNTPRRASMKTRRNVL